MDYLMPHRTPHWALIALGTGGFQSLDIGGCRGEIIEILRPHQRVHNCIGRIDVI